MSDTTSAGTPAPAAPRWNAWAHSVAESLAAVTGWESPVPATAEEYGRSAALSIDQARHVLNGAAGYGYVTKTAARVRGARFVYVPAPRACRWCGCTPERACAGGCWWAEFDLCSVCRAEARRQDDESRDHAGAVSAAQRVAAPRGPLLAEPRAYDQ